jgi:hypothetical protein
MPFTKGDENINRLGRPIGSKNKLYATRRFIFNLLENDRDKLMFEMRTLKGEKYVQLYMRLLEFVLAKRTNQILKVDKLSDKEIQDLLDSIN